MSIISLVPRFLRASPPLPPQSNQKLDGGESLGMMHAMSYMWLTLSPPADGQMMMNNRVATVELRAR